MVRQCALGRQATKILTPRHLVQAEVGEPGSETHAERERLLRSAIGLKARVTAAQAIPISAEPFFPRKL